MKNNSFNFNHQLLCVTHDQNPTIAINALKLQWKRKHYLIGSWIVGTLYGELVFKNTIIHIFYVQRPSSLGYRKIMYSCQFINRSKLVSINSSNTPNWSAISVADPKHYDADPDLLHRSMLSLQRSVSDPYSFDTDPAFLAEYRSGSGAFSPQTRTPSTSKIKFINFCLFLFIFALLDLDPDKDPGTQLNPDPIQIRIHNTGSFLSTSKNFELGIYVPQDGRQ